ncbi:GTPase family protein [Reinekea blandensis]|uniref:G domain-containing protein n=1 Tax=Reinekea blandensis MED297 TaxID=314283 RepID=A4BFM5_9GAMM|nr:GTPase [Reinekea blandensis]EAR09120.1 hypothetical protein MED297_17298 [Reinekea sp. MED297] [Reinekea blandensis MED297]
MTKTTRITKTLLSDTRWLLPFLLFGLIAPVLTLLVFGMIYVIQNGHWLMLLVIFVATFLIGYLMSVVIHYRQMKSVDQSVQDMSIEASENWSEFDHSVWQAQNIWLEEQLKASSEWTELLPVAQTLLQNIAHAYNKGDFDFSVVETLALIEEISRRYRVEIRESLPFVENLKLSYVKYGYDKRETLKTGLSAYKVMSDAHRIYRLLNPVSAVTGEIRRAIFGDLFNKINSASQMKLKKYLLQEVASVGIDLYSGRFVISDSELVPSEVANADKQRQAPALEPLRLCLVGQVSSGKSSVVNALTQSVDAEVNRLPSTDRVVTYQCRKHNADTEPNNTEPDDGTDVLTLVDLPGLDGQQKTSDRVLSEVVNADVVLWLLKANQPSRALDVEFKAQLDDYFQQPANRSRRRPVVIGVLNQIDLLKPASEWQPPYDYEQPKSLKERLIADALAYNAEQLNLQTLIPVCVAEQKTHFNTELLMSLINEHYADGVQIQLNRRRLSSDNRASMKKQLQRAGRLSQSLFKVMKEGHPRG